MEYIYLDKNSDYNKKLESISTQFSAKPKSGIFWTISKAFSSVVGFFKSFFSSKPKAHETKDETDTPVFEYLIKNIQKSFEVLGNLEAKNYILAFLL